MPGSRMQREGNGRRAPGPVTASGHDVQAEIAGLRGRLLGGRGPGATRQETAQYMSERATVGAVPTVIERELVGIRAGLARGDTDALSRDADRARDNLAETLDALASRMAPRRLASRSIEAGRARAALVLGVPTGTEATSPAGAGAWWRVAVRAAALGAAVTVGLGLLVRAGRRPGTTTPGPDRPR